MKTFLKLSTFLIVANLGYNCGFTAPAATTPTTTPTPTVTSPFTYTNGDGKAELTGVPTFSPTSIIGSSGGQVTVTVPADTDTGMVYLNMYNRMGVIKTNWSTTKTVVLSINSNDYVAGDYVYVEIILATSVSASSTAYNKYGLLSAGARTSGTTYENLYFSNGTSTAITDTGVTIPTLTIN